MSLVASTGAALFGSAVRGTARQAVVVAGAAAAAAVRTRGEVDACMRGARTCWWGKWCAHAERCVGVGVSCEHWRFPLLCRLCEAQRDMQWRLQVQPLLPRYARVARWSPACGERALAGRASGALTRRGVSRLCLLRALALPSIGRLCEAQRDRQWWLLGQSPLLLTRGKVVARVRGVHTCWKGKGCAREKRAGGAGVSCEHRMVLPSLGRLCEAQRDKQ